MIRPASPRSTGCSYTRHVPKAACPAHDVAFDTGLFAVNGGLRIHVARSLSDATAADSLARQYYGRPPLLETLLLPAGAQPPGARADPGCSPRHR